jgi:pilus biogenesis lipoprotein CpaD
MTMNIKYLLRGFSLAAMLMAGSCAVPPTNDGRSIVEDGAVNHPIEVEPAYQSMKLYYSPADTGISPADQARFDSFVADYQDHGNGSIAVSAPAGINSKRAMIGFFAQRINDMGVPKDHILVASHDAPDGDMRVEINYVSYQAHTDKCGDWSENLALLRRQSDAQEFWLLRAAQYRRPGRRSARPAGTAHHGRRKRRAPRHRDEQLREGRNHIFRQEPGPVGAGFRCRRELRVMRV